MGTESVLPTHLSPGQSGCIVSGQCTEVALRFSWLMHRGFQSPRLSVWYFWKALNSLTAQGGYVVRGWRQCMPGTNIQCLLASSPLDHWYPRLGIAQCDIIPYPLTHLPLPSTVPALWLQVLLRFCITKTQLVDLVTVKHFSLSQAFSLCLNGKTTFSAQFPWHSVYVYTAVKNPSLACTSWLGLMGPGLWGCLIAV